MSFIQDYNALARANTSISTTVSPLATAPQPAEPKPPCPGCGMRKTHRDCRTKSCIRCCAADSVQQAVVCGVKNHAAAAEYLRLQQGSPAPMSPPPLDAVEEAYWHDPPLMRTPDLLGGTMQEDAGLLLSFAQPSASDAGMVDLFSTFTTINDLSPTIPDTPNGRFPSPLPNLETLIPPHDVPYPASPAPPPPSQPRLPPPPPSHPQLPQLPTSQARPPPPLARRVLLPASSVPNRAPPRPKMTQQMNADWMDDNLGPGADNNYPTAPSSSMHVRSRKPRNYVDTRLVRRFTAGVFIEPGIPIDIVSIDECPDWPQWLASKARDALPELLDGLGPRDRIDVYMPDTGTWMGIPLDYIHALTTDCKVFLRRRGPRWDDGALEADIKRQLAPPASNMRHNLVAERTALRREYADLRRGSPSAIRRYLPDIPLSPALSSCSEMSDVGFPSQPNSRKRSYEPDTDDDDDGNSMRPTNRPRLAIDTSASSSSSSDSAPPSTPTTASSASPQRFPAQLPPPVSGFGGMYYVDVVAGFNNMSVLKGSGKANQEERFRASFPGRRYAATTFKENYAKWKNAPAGLKQMALEAGKTEAGLWRLFAERVAAARR